MRSSFIARRLPPVVLFALPILAIAVPSARAAEFPAFKEQVIDPHCGDVCYALTLADVDGDGRQDIVAVTENRVLWYQNPTWKKRVIIQDQTERDNVCIAPHDIDGDGKVDFALGAGWTKVGTIQWLSRGGSLDEKWNVHFIGKEPWTHRMRWADVLGAGRPQLVVSPLNKFEGNAGVRLTAFSIPKDPRSDPWPRTVLDDTLNRMHNHWHFDASGDGEIVTLTASEEGVFAVRRKGERFEKRQLPHSRAAGEVKVGHLRRNRRFVTTIEPMHGRSAVVYLQDPDADEGTRRVVLDDSLVRGHALWTADLDGDGSDEIVIGHSNTAPGENKPRGVYVFDAADGTGTKWTKHVIDEGGVAVEDIVAGDLTGDKRIDIVAGGRYTHNIKLYVNQGPQTERPNAE